jgi:hypothetical protein
MTTVVRSAPDDQGAPSWPGLAPPPVRQKENLIYAGRALDHADLDRIYEQFRLVNDRFKELILAWQMTGEHTLNEHSDCGYDRAIIARPACTPPRHRSSPPPPRPSCHAITATPST